MHLVTAIAHGDLDASMVLILFTRKTLNYVGGKIRERFCR